ncbi:AraC family transcriptional regulator [Piscinibacter sp. XHJ-5]|uniref:AraC family transcriptional regulator n=1 Tax=Piscinibacter sp. XHJ-5 TaxID=3037797 RepID=UPI0024535FB4|nr:AraC family transcriptional regulator [Piscinibacter sp. XHJ-5]
MSARLTIPDDHRPTHRRFDHASRTGGRGPGCLAALLHVARRRGVSTARLLACTGLAEGDLADPGCVIPQDAEHHAIENLIALCGDGSGLGLEVGARYRFTTLGPLGFAMASGSTLADATRLVLDYGDLFDPFVALELQADDSRFGVTVRPRLVSPELVRFVTERAVAALLTTWRDIARRNLLPRGVSFAFARPVVDEPYSHLTGLEVGFAATHTRLSMDTADMALPLAHADAYAVRVAEGQCRQLREAVRDRASVAGGVKALLRAHPEGMPDMGQVAAALCMSERTLRRRLQKEGTTFAALCDEIRRSTAEQLLSCSHLPIEHIASRLGYAEPASFIHAFKRWKGRTPGAFRSALHVGGHGVIPPRAALASPTPEPGKSMSQQQFEAFMAAQVAAIEASGVEPEAWIERHSTTFRAAWEDSHGA